MSHTMRTFVCVNCRAEILEEAEYIDNSGVCDECYSIPTRKRRGLAVKRVYDNHSE